MEQKEVVVFCEFLCCMWTMYVYICDYSSACIWVYNMTKKKKESWQRKYCILIVYHEDLVWTFQSGFLTFHYYYDKMIKHIFSHMSSFFFFNICTCEKCFIIRNLSYFSSKSFVFVTFRSFILKFCDTLFIGSDLALISVSVGLASSVRHELLRKIKESIRSRGWIRIIDSTHIFSETRIIMANCCELTS